MSTIEFIPTDDEMEKYNGPEQEPLGRGMRRKILSLKAREERSRLQEELFWKHEVEFRAVVEETEASLRYATERNTLETLKKRLEDQFNLLSTIFQDLREVESNTLDRNVRQAMDRVMADRSFMRAKINIQLTNLERAEERLMGYEDFELLMRQSTESARSRVSHVDSRSHHSPLHPGSGRSGSHHSGSHHSGSHHSDSRRSSRSHLSSLAREARASAAAHEAEMKAMQAAAHEEEELCRLEIQQLQLQKDMERKRCDLEIARMRGQVARERARAQAYEESEYQSHRSERQSQRNELFSLRDDNRLLPQRSLWGTPNPIRTTNIEPLSTAHAEVTPQSTRLDRKSDMALLAEAISSSMRMAQVPTPEPPVFSGDALQYADWNAAFTALIENRAISEQDKLFYLKKYVTGEAKEAITGLFLLQSADAYKEARKILEQRYGNDNAVTVAFREKLGKWPVVRPDDPKALRNLSDFLQNVNIAKAQRVGLNILDDYREINKIVVKLPQYLVNRWGREVGEKYSSGQYPSFRRFSEFVRQASDNANHPLLPSTKLKKVEKHEKKDSSKARTLSTEVKEHKSKEKKIEEKSACTYCGKTSHKIEDCYKFQKLSMEERIQFLKDKGACFGCLQTGHMSRRCSKRMTCATCEQRHPTLLHREKKEETTEEEKKATSVENQAVCGRISDRKDVKKKLSAMIVPVWVSSQKSPEDEYLVYALLDTQSDTTFILDEVLDKLHDDTQHATLKLATMAARQTIISCRKTSSLQVRGFYSNNKIQLPTTYSREFIPADRSQIPSKETADQWTHLDSIRKHLPPAQDCPIGLLIGYNCPAALAPRSCLTRKEDKPYAVETALGWSVVGAVSAQEECSDAIGYSHRIVVKNVPEELQIGERSSVSFRISARIKELCPVDIVNILESDFKDDAKDRTMISQQDMKFLNMMRENIHQNEDGNYVMPLPLKDVTVTLPDNREAVLRRFNTCQVKRFSRDKKYFKDYKKFMDDIMDRGDIEEVPTNELGRPSWYIPHHGVYHPKKPDKIRIVFDCSAKYKGICLNDCLLQGPDLTNGLLGVLLRFRQERIAIMCDIEKMFHQFKIREEDRDLLRFIWFNDKGDVADYRMKVHLFGATSSPSCANYGLKQVAKDHATGKPEVEKFINRSFYVDDGLKSIATVEEGKKLIQETVQVCKKGNLRLHKFVANDPQVLESLPVSERADLKDKDLQLDAAPLERALGVQWCIESDCFRFCVSLKDCPLTRRRVLSMVASVYDPFGFLAPFVLQGKQILQDLCKENVGWDDPLPEEIQARWQRWCEDLPNLKDISVTRCCKPTQFTPMMYELHHFSDASTTGYGQCSYLRCIDNQGQVHCSLVMAKSRVAPTKITTIPRLELQAAVVSAKIGALLEKELEIEVQHYYHIDSKVVLGYIANDAKRFHVFVANRVQTISELTDRDRWKYVATDENPADHASRGLNASDLLNSKWFTGPDFLWEQKVKSEGVELQLSEEDPEVKTVNSVKALADHPLLDKSHKFSNWNRLVSALSCLLRRVSNKGNEKSRIEKTLVRALQDHAFGCSANKNPELKKLDAFRDEDGMLRVGGRLKHSSEPYEVKHPLILPKDHHITRLIIRHFHEKVQHQGRGITMNMIRASGYWIVGANRSVSSVIHKCVTCRKLRGKPQVQKMADLPQERVEESPPFTYTGMDCFGPFYVKDGRKISKKYGLLFTCMASRAVHVELLNDMTADAFINGLRCMIAIRGPVKALYSDQGTNFVGAQNEFVKAYKEMEQPLQSFLKKNDCTFNFNVPFASHMGGVWERQIRSIRSVLSALLMQHSERLDTSSLRTFFYEAMAIVNSRPLTVDGLQDPTGPLPITPNHLLTMKSEVMTPLPGTFAKEDIYGRKRWRKVQQLANEFWCRWKKEYLSNIQKRQKWTGPKRNIQVGDVVILKEEDMTRTWRLGRVIKTTVSKDGFVRSVRLKTGETLLDRPIHKLVVLIEKENQE